MRRTFDEVGFDRMTGERLQARASVECPKWRRDPGGHEAFTVSPRPAPPPMPPPTPICTCQKTPTGLIPTTVNCPIHGSWTYTDSTTS